METLTTTVASTATSSAPTAPAAPSNIPVPTSKNKHPTLGIPAKSWRRIALCIFGVSILTLVWQLATYHLYSLPSTSVSSFTTITVTLFTAIASIIVFMVSGQMLYEAKLNTAVSVATAGIEETKKIIVTKDHVDETAKNENLREFKD